MFNVSEFAKPSESLCGPVVTRAAENNPNRTI